MNNVFFYDNLYFHTYTYGKRRYTDNRAGSPHHYLAYMESGSSRIVSEEITLEMQAGDVFYIPKDLPYQSYWWDNDTIKFKSLGFEFFPESRTRQFLLQKISCTEELRQRIAAIPTEAEADSALIGTFYSVLADILPMLAYSRADPKAEIIEKARKYIYGNTNCRVADIARHCLLSESALYAIFQKEAGLSPNELIRKTRCDKAVFLLTTTNQSVQEISDALGFSSTSYFRKVLHLYTGKTPREIRRELHSI